MMSTSTPTIILTENKADKHPADSLAEDQSPDYATPSARTIEAILNYSKNLEIRKSRFVHEIEFIKS